MWENTVASKLITSDKSSQSLKLVAFITNLKENHSHFAK